MAFDLFIRMVSGEVADLVQMAGNKWAEAVNKMNDGTYTSVQAQADAKVVGEQFFNLVTTALFFSPTVLAPVARITWSTGPSLTDSVYLPVDASVGLGSPITLTKIDDDTEHVQATATIPDPAKPNLVEIKAPDPVGAPPVGTYLGAIRVSSRFVGSVVLDVVP